VFVRPSLLASRCRRVRPVRLVVRGVGCPPRDRTGGPPRPPPTGTAPVAQAGSGSLFIRHPSTTPTLSGSYDASEARPGGSSRGAASRSACWCGVLGPARPSSTSSVWRRAFAWLPAFRPLHPLTHRACAWPLAETVRESWRALRWVPTAVSGLLPRDLPEPDASRRILATSIAGFGHGLVPWPGTHGVQAVAVCPQRRDVLLVPVSPVASAVPLVALFLQRSGRPGSRWGPLALSSSAHDALRDVVFPLPAAWALPSRSTLVAGRRTCPRF